MRVRSTLLRAVTLMLRARVEVDVRQLYPLKEAMNQVPAPALSRLHSISNALSHSQTCAFQRCFFV